MCQIHNSSITHRYRIDVRDGANTADNKKAMHFSRLLNRLLTDNKNALPFLSSVLPALPFPSNLGNLVTIIGCKDN